MAVEIKSATGRESKLVPGSGGVFDVINDGETVYSKSKTDRFPRDGELTGLLAGNE